jgi:hypothetical protein
MEPPVIEDIVGDNEPSATGGLTFVDGKVGGGVTFDPRTTTPCGGYIDVPDSPCLRLQRFTIQAWARPEGPGPTTDGWGDPVITKTVSGDYQSISVSWSAEGAPVEPLPRDGQWTRKPNRFLVVYGSHWIGEFIESEIECPPGEFYHVAVTYDGTTFKLFVNGILTGEKVDGRSITYTSSRWVMGSHTYRCWFPRTWNGVIDDVRIYDRTLSAEEIWQLYDIEVEVALDVKPGSCPNPFNLASKGVTPVAVLGTEDLDVNDIDPVSVELAGVSAIRSNYQDVATPLTDGNKCDCSWQGPDGYMDLTLKFRTQQLVTAIVDRVEPDAELALTLTGVLKDGTPIEGVDCIILVGNVPRIIDIIRADINGDGTVNGPDFLLIKNNWYESWK